MLGKLLKLDIKFGYKKFLTMAAVMLLGGILLPIVTDITGAMGIMSVFVFGVIIIGILSVWLIVQHFYRNFFSSEGYLMFTLPAKSWALLLSKVIITLLWYNVMLIAAVIMVLLLSRDQVTFSQAWEIATSSDFLPSLIQMWVMMNAIAIPIIMSLYTGLSLSTIALRRRTLGKIPGIGIAGVLLFGFFWCLNKATDILSDYLFPSGYQYGLEPLTFLQEYGQSLVILVLAIVYSILLFFITNYILSKKLNLK